MAREADALGAQTALGELAFILLATVPTTGAPKAQQASSHVHGWKVSHHLSPSWLSRSVKWAHMITSPLDMWWDISVYEELAMNWKDSLHCAGLCDLRMTPW